MDKVYSTHKTYTNSAGVPVPSATTILKILHKPQLMKWANGMGFRRQKIEDILLDSSLMGTNVHAMIEYELTGKQSDLALRHQGELIRLQNHMLQFDKWRASHTSITPTFMEGEYTTDNFGGTIDFYGDVDGKQSIVDFKTSKRFYSSMFLQLAAYIILLEEKGHTIEQVGIVRINETKFEEKFIPRAEMDEYIDTFKKLAIVFHAWYDLNLAEGWGSILD